MTLLHQRKNKPGKDGQMLLVFAFLLPVLLMFAGLAIDLGFAYVTKTTLSKAVDAAALDGMRNPQPGASSGHGDCAKCVQYQLRNSARPRRYSSRGQHRHHYGCQQQLRRKCQRHRHDQHFLHSHPVRIQNLDRQFQFTGDAPQAHHVAGAGPLGSMNLNGGAQALPPAVDSFLTYFDDVRDQVAMVSFSSTARVDVTIRTGFTSIITSTVNRMPFGGATYTRGGLLNGQTQIDSIPTVPGENVVKVAVFFTDGWANTVNDTLNCPPSTSLNFGGCSPPEAAVGWCRGVSFMDPITGNGRSCGAAQFPSQSAGSMQAINAANIATDAMYRSVLVANSMRTQNIVVYSIGLGDKISQPFLQQIANDPASPTFNPNQPVGEAVFAPTPADLQGVFQIIAAKILLRLSR
jgi:Putative Flp pilus-assembly TadE/G-like/von Willebrand factor type A domain